MTPRTSAPLSQFLIEQRNRSQNAGGTLNSLRVDMDTTRQRMAESVKHCALSNPRGKHSVNDSSVNVKGETPKMLGVLSYALLAGKDEGGNHLTGVASQRTDALHPIPVGLARSKCPFVVEPLEGSSNIDATVSMGSVLSIMRAPRQVANGAALTAFDFCQPGSKEVSTGDAFYEPPNTMVVLSVGGDVYGLT